MVCVCHTNAAGRTVHEVGDDMHKHIDARVQQMEERMEERLAAVAGHIDIRMQQMEARLTAAVDRLASVMQLRMRKRKRRRHVPTSALEEEEQQPPHSPSRTSSVSC